MCRTTRLACRSSRSVSRPIQVENGSSILWGRAAERMLEPPVISAHGGRAPGIPNPFYLIGR